MQAGRTDPVSVVKDYDAAWNAHDEAAVMDLIADDAVYVLEPDPGVLTGKEQVRSWMQEFLPGFHVETWNHQVSGDTVTWSFRVSNDHLRNMGVDEGEGTAEAVVEEGRIKRFTPTFGPETAERLQAAGS